jgi:hypothetical protein
VFLLNFLIGNNWLIKVPLSKRLLHEILSNSEFLGMVFFTETNELVHMYFLFLFESHYQVEGMDYSTGLMTGEVRSQEMSVSMTEAAAT